MPLVGLMKCPLPGPYSTQEELRVSVRASKSLLAEARNNEILADVIVRDFNEQLKKFLMKAPVPDARDI